MASHSRFAIAVVVILIAELIVPRVAWAAEFPSGPTAVASGFQEQTPSVKPSSAAPARSDADSVTQTGAFTWSIPIQLPPGRNGAAPSLALQYSSDAAQDASPFGAGWSLPLSGIRRTTKFGTPPIVFDHALTKDRYRDDELPGEPPIFERDGTLLVRNAGELHGGDPVFRDQVDRTFAKSIYRPASESWLVYDRTGMKHYYGRHTSTDRFAVRDPLGVTAWLLVRTEDPFGNVVDYDYVAAPADSAGRELEPLLWRVRWGKNLVTGALHHAQVEVRYRTLPQPLRIDYRRGHTYLDRIGSDIDVSILSPRVELVRTYHLETAASMSSTRLLLQSVQERTPGGLNRPPITFEYSKNGAGS
jgi:hypothetical protein